MSISAIERKNDLAIMKAVGIQNRNIYFWGMLETLVYSIFACLGYFAGLYISYESHKFEPFREQGQPEKDPFATLDDWNGAFLMLQQEHMPTDVLTRRDLNRLAEYPVIFLADAVCMSDAEADASQP